ncbi:hypothetical protein L9F63_013657, partial [Diploptera punctata]
IKLEALLLPLKPNHRNWILHTLHLSKSLNSSAFISITVNGFFDHLFLMRNVCSISSNQPQSIMYSQSPNNLLFQISGTAFNKQLAISYYSCYVPYLHNIMLRHMNCSLIFFRLRRFAYQQYTLTSSKTVGVVFPCLGAWALSQTTAENFYVMQITYLKVDGHCDNGLSGRV